MTKQFRLFKNLIKKINTPIYLSGHIKPDHDSICSCLSLARLLEKLGKEAYVILDENDMDILSIHENKHLVVNDVTHNDYAFIALDMNESYRLGKFKKYFEPASVKINIDHHQGNRINADLIIADQEKSSTCEIIYNLIKSYGKIYLDKDIAECLYTGIMTDTSCFSRRLSPDTMKIAQKLINYGVDYERSIKATFSYRTLYELKALGVLIEEIKVDEMLHYLVIDKSREEFKNLTHNQITKTIAEELRKIEDMDIFLIFIVEGHIITTKCMSNVTKNANLIAQQFGGGGHKGEAGFTVLNTTIEEILEKTKNYLKENNQ